MSSSQMLNRVAQWASIGICLGVWATHIWLVLQG